MNAAAPTPVELHHPVRNLSDRVAYGTTRALRFFADTLFAKRYGNRAIVLETEGGHLSFAPGTDEEIAIFKVLRRDFGRVSNERVICGSGLVNLYGAVCEIAAVPRRATRSKSRSSTADPVRSSRLPLGSSASRMSGSTTSARASATRWHSPPDRREGR